MTIGVYVARSHDWLHGELLSGEATAGDDFGVVARREDADLILYPEPPWFESGSRPERPWHFKPRELQRLFVYSQHDTPIVWAPGVYAGVRASKASPNILGGFYVPAQHGSGSTLPGALDQARFLEPDLLWSFVGTVENAGVRRTIAEIKDERGLVRDTQQWSRVTRWGWWDDLKDEGERDFREYANLLGRSKFVLCPRGLSPNSIRIFEALQAGRCPVVIADDWLPPPRIDWSRCSIRVKEADAAALSPILREREAEFDALAAEARATWETWFAPARRLATLVRASCDLRTTISYRTRIELALRVAGNPDTARRLRWSLHDRRKRRQSARA